MVVEKQNTSKIFKSRKTKIHFNEEEEQIAFKQAGMYRYVYNWGIEKENNQYELSKDNPDVKSFLNYKELAKLYTFEKNNNENMKFLNEDAVYTVGIARMALKDVINAFKSFFEGINNRPTFKRRKGRHASPTIVKYRKEKTYIVDGGVRLEGFPRGHMISLGTNNLDNIGYYPGHSIPRENGEWVTPTISFNKDYWNLSFQVPSTQETLECEKSEAIGIDVNKCPTYATSEFEKFQQPDTTKYDNKIKRLNRKLNKAYNRRKEKAKELRTKVSDIPLTKNEEKLMSKMRKVHRKKSNIKNNFYHNIGKMIVKRNPECVCIEHLRVSKLCKEKPYMWKQLQNTSFYKMLEIIKGNCHKYKVPLLEADTHYPSSRICSNCGKYNHKLGNRKIFKCPYCGFTMDRDFNSSINLKNLWINRDNDTTEYEHKLWLNN